MPTGGTEFFGEFESEHLLSQELFNNDERATVLKRLGYTRDMASNLQSLFISTEIVDQLSGVPETNSFKEIARQSRWGTVLHRGGDTSVGGFQAKKTTFK